MFRSLGSTVEAAKRRRDREIWLEELKGSLDVDALLYDTLGITNAQEGRNGEIVHSCILPFGMHRNGDRTPSASFSRDRLKYNCWSCGGGDVFWLLASVKDISLDDAISELLGQLQPREKSADEFLAELEKLWANREVSLEIPHYSPSIIKPWRRLSDYLLQRRVSHDTQRAMQTGVDLANRELFEKGEVKEWLTQPRVTIPLFFRGQLCGWQKRKISDSQFGPKYRSSPGFPRSQVLYGWDEAMDSDSVIVVESALSVLVMRSEGIHNVVSTLGAEVTDEQLALLHRFDSVYVFMDGDGKGQRATADIVERLEDHVKLWVVPYEVPDTDPGDYDRAGLDALLKWAEPAVTWSIAHA